MRLQQTLFHLLTFITAIQALALPAAFNSIVESGTELYKRKGGGGGRGGGSSSSSGSSGGRTGGSSSSSGSSGSRGGGSSSGTGAPRSFGGGRYYGGGAAQPYRAGSTSGWRGPAPFLLGAGALALFPGLWLYGAYAYRYDDNNGERTYYNETSDKNETRPVTCLCGQYQQCGCAQTDDQEYLNEVANNNTLSSVKNGTLCKVIRGILTFRVLLLTNGLSRH